MFTKAVLAKTILNLQTELHSTIPVIRLQTGLKNRTTITRIKSEHNIKIADTRTKNSVSELIQKLHQSLSSPLRNQ